MGEILESDVLEAFYISFRWQVELRRSAAVYMLMLVDFIRIRKWGNDFWDNV